MKIRFDSLASVIFFLVGTGYLLESRNISESAYGSSVGPDIFPMGLSIIMMLLSVKLFFESLKTPLSNENNNEQQKPDYVRFLLILGAAFIYAYFLEDIGYVIGTFIFLLFCFQVLERGKWLTSILVSAGFSAAVYVLFVKILQGTLPGFPEWLPL
ncbi:tripartite tricarboxylate transporter TctB family protein [Paenibacillus sp. 481]|uniref:tripartite tricarboxylate transporter TctB family protein n=1 Tax=Paenibacillus sp. 481 TaxID=2835869 RepID=UPI001E46FFAE|nr:tripartite tricarboxylate transporter TctB family protein [Paenibacillus sp. 481]UHA72396.1 tripartite tricarboxylate transporter TctB family protein [Paenibacillus sp. 481]